jgi:dephospho-CoA kinase
MAAQIPEAEKAKAADFVIDNSGSLDNTKAQVRELWEKLRTQATNNR